MLQWEGVEHNKKSGPVVKRIRSPRAIRESIDGKVRGDRRGAPPTTCRWESRSTFGPTT